MSTIILGIPLAECARNVLQTETFEILANNPSVRVVIVTPAASDFTFRERFARANVEIEPIIEHEPTVSERVVNSARLASLAGRSTTVSGSIMPRTWGRRLQPVIKPVRRILGPRRLGRVLGRLETSQKAARLYDPLFDLYQPDLVVTTRALNWSADYALLKCAARRSVPSIALVASWDNLTSKAFFPGRVGSIVVWNDTMRQEAVDLLSYEPHQIVVTGVPRFDRYFRRQGLRNRGEFFAALGFDAGKPLITYAAGHRDLFQPGFRKTPEPFVADRIAEHFTKDGSAQLLVRLHPQAELTSYAALHERDGVVVHHPGEPSAFPDRFLTSYDEQVLAETMLHSDVVVNVASTMTIDAAVFDTPTVCVGYDPGRSVPFKLSVRRFYHFDHYRKLVALGGLRIASSESELFEDIERALECPTLGAAGRVAITREQVKYCDGNAGRRVAEHLLAQLSLGLK